MKILIYRLGIVDVCLRCFALLVCICTSVPQHVYVLAFICVFSLIFFSLYFHQITNSNELPLAIIAHFSADPTR